MRKQTRNPTIAHEQATPSVRLSITQNIRPVSHVLQPMAAQETRPALSVHVPANSLRGMVICEISPLTQSVTFRSLQKNLSIYFVVSLQSTTFASAEIRKLGKMSLLTSVNPLHRD